MSLIALTLAAALSTGPADALPAPLAVPHQHAVKNQQIEDGTIMTTPDGCTYRRTKAAGYPARWVLILNPHRFDLPPAHRGCRGLI